MGKPMFSVIGALLWGCSVAVLSAIAMFVSGTRECGDPSWGALAVVVIWNHYCYQISTVVLIAGLFGALQQHIKWRPKTPLVTSVVASALLLSVLVPLCVTRVQTQCGYL